MKVLMLTPFFRPDNHGGAVKVYESLLQNKDFESHIICPVANAKFDDERYFLDTGLKIHRCQKIQFSFSSNFLFIRLVEYCVYRYKVKRELDALINDIRPDIIINGGVRWFGWLTKMLLKKSPVINYIHGEELSIAPVGIFGRWLFRTQNSSFSQVKFNICVSSYTSNKLQEMSSSAFVKVLTNFVDNKRFYPAKNIQNLKSKHNINTKISLICICRLIERKGVDDLLNAISQLKKNNNRNIVLNVCGSGPELKNLQLLSRDLGIEDLVIFHGFTEEKVMLELLQASDVFVMPNKTIDGDLEGFGLVFLEAGACGLPVIGGKSGGVVDAIDEGFSGYLVEPGDITDLVSKLDRLITDSDIRKQLGGNGYKRAIENFTLESKKKEFQALLHEAYQGG